MTLSLAMMEAFPFQKNSRPDEPQEERKLEFGTAPEQTDSAQNSVIFLFALR